MKFVLGLLLIPFFGVPAMFQYSKCLPADVKPSEVTSVSRTGPSDVIKITVDQALGKLKARCSHGKLVDRKGRQIRFFRLLGCWGNPPANYGEILDRQRKEIARLRTRYTMVEMTCNPSGEPIQ